MTANQINEQFLDRVNEGVANIARARRSQSMEYVDNVLLPQHEKDMTVLASWRTNQLNRIKSLSMMGFSAKNFGAMIGFSNKNFGSFAATATRAPKAISAAFQQAYNAKAAEIAAIAKSAIAAAQKAYKDVLASNASALHQLLADANAKAKQAQKLHDTASLRALQAAAKDAKAGAAAANNQAKIAMTQQVTQAQATQQNSLRALNDQLTGLFGQTTAYTPPVAPTLPNQAPGSTPPQYPQPYYPPPTVTSTGGGDLPYGPEYQTQPIDPSQQPMVPSDTFDNNLWYGGADLIPGWDFFAAPEDYNSYTPPALSPPVSGTNSPKPPAYNPSNYDPASELDVFNPDAWGFGKAIGTSKPGMSLFGSRTIQAINKMPVLPARSYGFAQWSAIVGSIIQAGASIGSAAASAALAPRPSTPRAPIQLTQPTSSATNYTPYLIGGGVLAVALVIFATRKRK